MSLFPKKEIPNVPTPTDLKCGKMPPYAPNNPLLLPAKIGNKNLLFLIIMSLFPKKEIPNAPKCAQSLPAHWPM